MKLAFRFTIALVAAMTLALALNALLRVRREVVLFDDAIASDAKTMSSTLAPFVAQTWREEGEAAAKALVANASNNDRVQIRLRLLDADNEDAPALAPGERTRLLSDGSVLRKYENQSGEDFVVTYVAIDVPGRPAVLEFSEPLRGQRAFVQRTILSAGVTAVVLALLCGASAMLLGVVFVGRPVRALVAQAQRIGAGDFSARLRLRQRDEIGDLAREFDLMSERLARARDDLKAATEAKLEALVQLRHAERVATVGKLAAGVAHELGTPLQVVSGYARLIFEDPASSADARENASIVHEQAGRMTTIIAQLLDFARQRPSERSPTNLCEIVERLTRLLAPVAEQANVRILAEPGTDETLIAVVDGEHIMQVASNLVVNAVQAMPSGGTVTIRLTRRTRDVDGAPRPYIVMTVSDTGLGMPEEVRTHVFEPFFTTKPTGQGTGLGLSVAYGIVQDHEGIFEVESEPGRGSTFAVWLPAGGDT